MNVDELTKSEIDIIMVRQVRPPLTSHLIAYFVIYSFFLSSLYDIFPLKLHTKDKFTSLKRKILDVKELHQVTNLQLNYFDLLVVPIPESLTGLKSLVHLHGISLTDIIN